MIIRKSFIITTVVLSLVAQGASALCLQRYEKIFFDLKALQSSMMVAALSCDLRAEYNSFMHKYSSILNESGNRVKSFFIKTHGSGNYKNHLNRFSTRLANSSTTVSMNQAPDEYCEMSRDYLSSLINARDQDVIYTILGMNRYESVHQMNLCY